MNNIQSVSDAYMCSNCGACNVICPQEAISYEFNSIGRMYAVVNDHCVDCGLCLKVCPSMDWYGIHKTFQDPVIGRVEGCYVGKSTDENYYKNSQSGGACTAILNYLFEYDFIDCAIVCKMSFGKTPIVRPIVIESEQELEECQKSCYTPVDILSGLKKVHGKRSVAVVGLPCHIQGIESLMRTSKKYANIKYRIGLICDRTLCAGIQDVMMSYFHNEEKAKIIWRRKDVCIDNMYYAYKVAPVTIVFENGKEHVIPNYYRFALKDFFTAPRCRVCYDKLNTFSDIVLGDPWGMSDIDWQKGESVVIVRNELGKKIVESIIMNGKLILSKRDISEVLIGQHIAERRRQVAAYSRILQSFPYKVDSYLYIQEEGINLSTEEIAFAKRMIDEFMRREKKDKDALIIEARRILRMIKINDVVKRSFIIKYLRKMRRMLR